MSDRELIEMAAKAAGINPDDLYDTWGDCGGIEKAGWNPLTDDGDALRLAVKLGITVSIMTKPGKHGLRTAVWSFGVPGNHEQHGLDPCAATRRSIVRAAAEIGKAKP